VKAGGRLVYVTCSVLPEENGDQIAWLTARHPELAVLPWRQTWADLGGEPPISACAEDALLLTPARHGTDGFFVSSLLRSA
jgi:16S rRNA (cytosine967-C5)-methyltransferase